MIFDVPTALQPIVRAIVACALFCVTSGAGISAEPRTNPTGGGDSIVLEPVPAATPPARTRRPVFVCHDDSGVIFADRPCGQVVEARTIEVSASAPGEAASTLRKPPSAAVRPLMQPAHRDSASARSTASANSRCNRLRAQLEALDDRMRSGYSAREAARLWNRWREVKAQIHEARC